MGPPSGTLWMVAIVLAAVIVVASVSLILQRLRHLGGGAHAAVRGLLASLGASRRQLRRTVLAEALVLGAVGVPLDSAGRCRQDVRRRRGVHLARGGGVPVHVDAAGAARRRSRWPRSWRAPGCRPCARPALGRARHPPDPGRAPLEARAPQGGRARRDPGEDGRGREALRRARLRGAPQPLALRLPRRTVVASLAVSVCSSWPPAAWPTRSRPSPPGSARRRGGPGGRHGVGARGRAGVMRSATPTRSSNASSSRPALSRGSSSWAPPARAGSRGRRACGHDLARGRGGARAHRRRAARRIQRAELQRAGGLPRYLDDASWRLSASWARTRRRSAIRTTRAPSA